MTSTFIGRHGRVDAHQAAAVRFRRLDCRSGWRVALGMPRPEPLPQASRTRRHGRRGYNMDIADCRIGIRVTALPVYAI
jgi:hypothetical protein